MAEIQIDNITRNTFVQRWNKYTSESNTIEFLNEIVLKVPFTIQRHKENILINSKLILTENNDGITIKLFSNCIKFVFISLLIGIVPSLLFLLLYSSIKLVLIYTIIISLIVFRMFYTNTKKISEKYLEKIKEDYI